MARQGGDRVGQRFPEHLSQTDQACCSGGHYNSGRYPKGGFSNCFQRDYFVQQKMCKNGVASALCEEQSIVKIVEKYEKV